MALEVTLSFLNSAPRCVSARRDRLVFLAALCCIREGKAIVVELMRYDGFASFQVFQNDAASVRRH